MPVGADGVFVGLYDRDYLRWTSDERARYLGVSRSMPSSPVRSGVLIAAIVTLVASLAGAKLFAPRLSSPSPSPQPIGCLGPSRLPCPPGSVRIPDPRDPSNPNEWPNDLGSRS
jgi:hypothetical protein